MINIIFIIIIIILIIIYVNKKKEHFTTTSSNITTFDIIKNYILNNKVDIKATRNLIEFIKYLYPNEQNITLPSDTTINSNFNTDEIIVETDCIIEDSVEIDNLIVDRDIYINNKNNIYNINRKEDNKNSILDILPIGSIIPWTSSTNLPVGWVLCNGQSTFSDDGVTEYLIPLIDGRIIMGCNTTNSVGETGGSESININFSNLPVHNHEMILNFTTMDQCKPSDIDQSKCIYSGFRFGTVDNYKYAEGNTNSILSFSPQYQVSTVLDTIYSSKCILYIIKIF